MSAKLINFVGHEHKGEEFIREVTEHLEIPEWLQEKIETLTNQNIEVVVAELGEEEGYEDFLQEISELVEDMADTIGAESELHHVLNQAYAYITINENTLLIKVNQPDVAGIEVIDTPVHTSARAIIVPLPGFECTVSFYAYDDDAVELGDSALDPMVDPEES